MNHSPTQKREKKPLRQAQGKPRKDSYLVRYLEKELENERAIRSAFEDLWNKHSRFLMEYPRKFFDSS